MNAWQSQESNPCFLWDKLVPRKSLLHGDGVCMCVWGALNMYEMGQGIPLQPQRGDSEDPCRESLGVTCPQAMGEAYVLLLPLLSLFSPQSVGLCP